LAAIRKYPFRSIVTGRADRGPSPRLPERCSHARCSHRSVRSWAVVICAHMNSYLLLQRSSPFTRHVEWRIFAGRIARTPMPCRRIPVTWPITVVLDAPRAGPNTRVQKVAIGQVE
jgi:hypothetical protein